MEKEVKFLLALILILALVGLFQEFRANKIMNTLQDMDKAFGILDAKIEEKNIIYGAYWSPMASGVIVSPIIERNTNLKERK